MITILRELKILSELHGLSMGEVSKYVGCSEKTVYNWLSYESSVPRTIYRERIKRAVRKIRREFETGLPLQEIKRLYRALERRLSAKEKAELLEIVGASGGILQPEYLEALRALAKIHGVKVSK